MFSRFVLSLTDNCENMYIWKLGRKEVLEWPPRTTRPGVIPEDDDDDDDDVFNST